MQGQRSKHQLKQFCPRTGSSSSSNSKSLISVHGLVRGPTGGGLSMDRRSSPISQQSKGVPMQPPQRLLPSNQTEGTPTSATRQAVINHTVLGGRMQAASQTCRPMQQHLSSRLQTGNLSSLQIGSPNHTALQWGPPPLVLMSSRLWWGTKRP